MMLQLLPIFTSEQLAMTIMLHSKVGGVIIALFVTGPFHYTCEDNKNYMHDNTQVLFPQLAHSFSDRCSRSVAHQSTLFSLPEIPSPDSDRGMFEYQWLTDRSLLLPLKSPLDAAKAGVNHKLCKRTVSTAHSFVIQKES